MAGRPRDGRPLDGRDLEILTILEREGRITRQDLARRVNLSPSACHERVRRLEAEGIIEGYRARLALARLARITTVFVEVTLESHRAEDFQRFERYVRDVDWIVDCHAIGGGVDYLMRVVVDGVESYQALIDQLLDAKIGIDRYFTYIVTKPVKEGTIPPLSRLIALPEAD